jgi:hypothetical protein
MQPQHSTSAQRPTRTLPRSNNVQPNRFVRQFWHRNNGSLSSFFAANAALLAQLQQKTATPSITDRQQSIPADATPTTEGGKAAPEPPIDLLDDEPEPPASDFVDSAYYGEFIPAGLERPPCDIDEPRLWTLTDDPARALSDKRTQSAYDKYLHIGCYAFFDSCANVEIGEALGTCRTAHLYRQSGRQRSPLS